MQRSLFRKVLMSAMAISAIGSGLTATATATATAAGQQIDWQPCPEVPTVLCGKLRLPVDWAAPNGATFELSFARRPADNPTTSRGALFINPGGPGGSGVNMTFSASSTFSSTILENFDLIGIDPRGVARSNQVVCSSEALELPGYTVMPRSRSEFDALVLYNRLLAADCRQQTGPLFDHVDSISVSARSRCGQGGSRLGEDQLVRRLVRFSNGADVRGAVSAPDPVDDQ